MEETIHFGALTIRSIFTDREVNFCVHKGSAYLFRLVPTWQGFVLSPLDQALDLEVDQDLVDQIGDQIERHYS